MPICYCKINWSGLLDEIVHNICLLFDTSHPDNGRRDFVMFCKRVLFGPQYKDKSPFKMEKTHEVLPLQRYSGRA